ncbi:MAG: Na+:solute symporter [Planctomycetes bacterium]|nr:Na+:solute symporter [Planctomycetota bacterium]
MLSVFDYAVIVAYFLLMIAIGTLCRRFNKNSSDYFRGGGQMSWWMVGSSAFMVQFSAWTFTGAAAMAYESGVIILVIYYANAIGYLLNYLWFAPWFRQMRVVTAMDAVAERFGRVSEQVFTWIQLPIQIFYAGIWLFGLAIFLSSVFGYDIVTTIWITGIVVTLMSTLGGAWAVVASDFIQSMVLLCISIVVAYMCFDKLGSWETISAQLPQGHTEIISDFHPEYGILWIIAMFIKQIFILNNFQDASKYLCVKDSRSARWAALLGFVLFMILPFFWFLPAMSAHLLVPDLMEKFSHMDNPQEASYVATCMVLLPSGLMGLLVAGIFSATMSSMDSGLNRNAGFFIKNFYAPILKPKATEKDLLFVGKIITIVFGLLVISTAILLSQLGKVGIFKIFIDFSAMVSIPYTVPLLFGLIIKRVPSWAGMVTMGACFLVSLCMKFGLNEGGVGLFLDTSALMYVQDNQFAFAVIMNVTVGFCVFAGSKLFFCPERNEECLLRADSFFEKMKSPVDFKSEIGETKDAQQEKLLGVLSAIYGIFIFLMLFIPNPWSGRVCIAICGSILTGVGLLLIWKSRRSSENNDNSDQILTKSIRK